MRGRGGLMVVALVLVAAPAGATVHVDVTPERSRVEAVAEALQQEIVRSIEQAPRGALVVRVRHAVPGQPTRAQDLVEALVGPLRQALASSTSGEEARWHTVHQASFGADEPAPYAARLGYDVLVDVVVEVLGNYLEVRASSWTAASATPHGEVVVRTRLDAELRHFVGGLPRVSAETLVARAADLPSRGYLALVGHDLDGDGRTELVAVTPSGVTVLRLGASRVGVRLVEVGRAPFPADVPPAAATSRRPVATAVRVQGGVVVRSSELAAPVRVELTGGRVVVTRATGPCADRAFPVEAGCAELAAGRDFFDDRMTPRAPDAPPPSPPGAFYAHASRRVRQPDGRVVGYEAIVTPQGRLAMRVGERSVAAVGYGTALAMADLDEDGAMELLTSAATAPGGGDRLALLRALPRGALRVVWRSEPIAGSVWIAERADLDNDGLDELLAVEEPADAQRGNARLWIVR